MTSEMVSVLSGEEEEDAALGYYDDEDDLEAFSDAELGCEDGGRRIFLLLRKVTHTHTHQQRASRDRTFTLALLYSRLKRVLEV